MAPETPAAGSAPATPETAAPSTAPETPGGSAATVLETPTGAPAGTPQEAPADPPASTTQEAPAETPAGTAQGSSAQAPAASTSQGDPTSIEPGEAYVTRFSGAKTEGGTAVTDAAGIVGSVVDVRGPGQAPQGHHWLNEPQRFPVTAGEVGQVFGVAFDDANPPNIYVTATSAFGLHRTADGSDWMPGQWGPGGGPGTVWKLDAANNYKPVVFAHVALDGRQNTAAALGAIVFDRENKQFLVSDLETGMITRLKLEDGSELGRYDHGTEGRASFVDASNGSQQSLPPVAFDPASTARIADCTGGEFGGTPACWNYADFRRRVWGLGLRRDSENAQRLFYAVWGSQGFGNPDFAAASTDDKRNSVWSIAIGADGNFDRASVRREYFVPDFYLDPEELQNQGPSNPVSDIEFPECTADPIMLAAERGGVRNLGLAGTDPFTFPHSARVLRFEANQTGVWQPTGRYDVGYYDRRNEKPPHLRSNAAGGVDFGFGYLPDWTLDPEQRNEWVWMTGDVLCGPNAPCFNPDTGAREDGSEVHGIEGMPAAAFDELASAASAQPYPAQGEPYPPKGPQQSWMVDLDQNLGADGLVIMESLTQKDGTEIGDVEVYEPCEGEPGAEELPPEAAIRSTRVAVAAAKRRSTTKLATPFGAVSLQAECDRSPAKPSDWATNCPEYKVTAVQVSPSNGPSEWQEEYEEQTRQSRRIAPALVAAE
jgi:hypothetical protein